MNKFKQHVRATFRQSVFARDNFCCRGCGKQFAPNQAERELDAHHITNRNQMPGGGYVPENGVSLCKRGPRPTCHENAETWLNEGAGPIGFSPAELYAKIGSSLEAAVAAAQRESSGEP